MQEQLDVAAVKTRLGSFPDARLHEL